MVDVILVGAGGHARAVVEALAGGGHSVVAYVDPHPAPWLSAAHYPSQEALVADGLKGRLALGIGGETPRALEMRLDLLKSYAAAGIDAISVIHPGATVSAHAKVRVGATILAGAVVQPDAVVGRGAIVGACAVLERDSVLDDGCHLAPASVVLGGCRIGRCSLIGAGAVVLPRTKVGAGSIVTPATRFPDKQDEEI